VSLSRQTKSTGENLGRPDEGEVLLPLEEGGAYLREIDTYSIVLSPRAIPYLHSHPLSAEHFRLWAIYYNFSRILLQLVGFKFPLNLGQTLVNTNQH
jgi:hypothetical protein